MSRSRNFSFTWNNYPEDADSILARVECRYMKYGREVGESGTPHLQGAIVFEGMKSLKQVIKILPGCHIEEARSIEALLKYVAKDGEVTERGEAPMDKKRKGETGGEAQVERYDQARKAAKEGRFDDIPSDLYARHFNAWHKMGEMRQRRCAPLDRELNNIWIYGEPGTGKSRWAWEHYPNAYIKNLSQWWDGYDPDYEGHKVVILDDFDKYHKTLTQMFKTWTSNQPFAAEIKGRQILIRPETIIVTSNYVPEEIWDDEVTRAAMSRRFTLYNIKNGELN